MADFVAVIRRAVDGLSDNTPEMRVKVYEKARGAVLRQLESMKPRPPEEMLRRQLDKLEAAILEVETEHAEALPAADEPEALDMAPVPDGAGPVDDDATVAAPVAEAEPAGPVAAAPVETVYSEEPPAETWSPQAPAHAEPEAYTEPHYEDVPSEAPAWEEPPRPAVSPVVAEPLGHERQAPGQGRAAPTLFGDESWAGEEEAASEPQPEPFVPAPVQQAAVPAEPAYVEEVPVLDYDEPVHHDVYHEEPVAYEPEPEPAPAEDPWQQVEDQDVPADFPVEEPTSHYSQPLAAEAERPAQIHDLWPQDGVQAAATGTVQPEEWTATAVYRAPDETPDHATPDLLAAYQDEPAPMDVVEPLAWDPSQTPLDVDAEPSEFVEVASVQGELAAAAQDRFDEPVLHGEARYEPQPEPDYDDAATVAPQAYEPVRHDQRGHDDAYHATPAPVAVEPAAPAQQPEELVEWDDSPFTDVPLPLDEQAREPKRADDDNWDEFQDFAAYGRDDKAQDEDLLDEDFVPAASDKPARSYRIQSRRRVDFTSIGLGLLGLALVAGSGYGAWTFRDTLSGLVTGLVSTPPADTTKPAAEQTPTKPADATKTATQTTTTSKPATPTPTDMASAEPEIQKFTQRLQADGSEVDAGTADGASADGEGRSLAPQTVASSEPVDTTTQPTNGNTGTSTPPAIPVGVSQKMYLYEERVGQASPAAVEGAVVWSLKHEKADNGKDEAIVQAQVSAPDRGLSALVSFKRNLDPSLPASHLVELVFSLPKEFEGGAIESVQRVAMKQTEQDRGDPLIAVPAKITDDFHMIALNDYADAREFNLRLLETRNWIDIPVTYRNGRRALITMEKGSTGTEAFNQAIREWRALDPTPAPAPAPATPPAQSQAPAPAANAQQTPATSQQ